MTCCNFSCVSPVSLLLRGLLDKETGGQKDFIKLSSPALYGAEPVALGDLSTLPGLSANWKLILQSLRMAGALEERTDKVAGSESLSLLPSKATGLNYSQSLSKPVFLTPLGQPQGVVGCAGEQNMQMRFKSPPRHT